MERIHRLKHHLSSSFKPDSIMNEPTLKDAHIYCIVNNISAQQYGPLLEKYIRTKFNYIKNNAKDCIGDCSKYNKNIEIKVSLGGRTHTKFNFVQIRPSQRCDYILTAYHLSYQNIEDEGELYIFKIPHTEIKNLIVSYGGYAHGTIKENGAISYDAFNENKEYAFRPIYNDVCWNALNIFRTSESEL